MELALGILKRSRLLFAAVAIAAAVAGIAMNNDTAYIVCIIAIVLTIAADAAVMVLSRKLGIQIKYHENMYTFKKRDKK